MFDEVEYQSGRDTYKPVNRVVYDLIFLQWRSALQKCKIEVNNAACFVNFC